MAAGQQKLPREIVMGDGRRDDAQGVGLGERVFNRLKWACPDLLGHGAGGFLGGVVHTDELQESFALQLAVNSRVLFTKRTGADHPDFQQSWHAGSIKIEKGSLKAESPTKKASVPLV